MNNLSAPVVSAPPISSAVGSAPVASAVTASPPVAYAVVPGGDLVVQAENVDVAPKRKRGRPSAKSKAEPVDVEEAVWTTAMIETLLMEKSYLKDMFLEAHNKEKIANGWSKIALNVNTDQSGQGNAKQRRLVHE